MRLSHYNRSHPVSQWGILLTTLQRLWVGHTIVEINCGKVLLGSFIGENVKMRLNGASVAAC
jgi:hypothetical protein